MKTLKKTIAMVTLLVLFSSCGSNQDDVLSDREARLKIMDTIANNHEMSIEMMNAMMKSKHGRMMLQGNPEMMKLMTENKDAVSEMMKENPAMMQGMMSGMMDAAKGDSAVMSGMLKSMMGDRQMMNGMQSMMGKGQK